MDPHASKNKMYQYHLTQLTTDLREEWHHEGDFLRVIPHFR